MKKVSPTLSLLVLLSLVIIGVYFLDKEELSDETVATSSADLNMALYSDRNITANAVIKDDRYSHLSFAEPEERNELFLERQYASVIGFLKQFTTWKLNFQVGTNDEREEHGAWVWTPTLQITPEYAETILTGLQAEGVNAVYLSIDSYLDVYAMEEGLDKYLLTEKFSKILNDFIARAEDKGIAVDAEAGWRNWAEEGHTYKAYIIVGYVKDFNQRFDNKFRGFQYDVEPYLLDEYRRDNEGKRAVLSRFNKLMDQTAEYLKDSDLKFSVVIPHFYDRKDRQTPKFSYAGREDYAFKHLLEILEKKPGSEVIIMSYRNFTYGQDGSLYISRNEMETARQGGFKTNIILAQETGDVPPGYITFYGTSKERLRQETEKLREAFGSNPTFAGMAIHYANAFLSLE